MTPIRPQQVVRRDARTYPNGRPPVSEICPSRPRKCRDLLGSNHENTDVCSLLCSNTDSPLDRGIRGPGESRSSSSDRLTTIPMTHTSSASNEGDQPSAGSTRGIAEPEHDSLDLLSDRGYHAHSARDGWLILDSTVDPIIVRFMR